MLWIKNVNDDIFFIRFFEFTVDRELQLHLSQNDFLSVGPVVHRGVHFPFNSYSAGIDVTESDVCRRQILMCKVDPRTVRVKTFIMAVDP